MKRSVKILLAILMVSLLVLSLSACQDPCADGHLYTPGEITKQPTCTSEGERTYTCSRCGQTFTQSIGKLPHSLQTLEGKPATCADAGLTSSFKCSVCGEIIPPQEAIPMLPAHTWDNGTVTTEPKCKDGEITFKCTVCGATRTEVLTARHNYDNGVLTVAPTCGEYGQRVYTCKDCGKTYQVLVAPMADQHVFGPWVEETDEHVGYFQCQNCGKYFDKDGNLLPSIDKNAHVCAHKCSTCGKCQDPYCEDLACADKCECIIDPEGALRATMEYTTKSTTNMKDGNNAQSVGLNASVFNITDTRAEGYSSHVGLNTNGQIRLYTKQNVTLNIAIEGNRKIAHIKVILDSKSPTTLDDLKVVVGVHNVKGVINEDKNEGQYAVNGTSVHLSNVNENKNDQIYIKQIIITYVDEGGEVQEHVCQHVCEVCGKCTSDCDDPACTDKCPGHDAPLAAGTYTIVLRDDTNDLTWYATGVITSKGALEVSKSDSKVAVLTVIYENDKYTLKIGDQYLEAYLNGEYKNMRLVASPSSNAIEWKWSSAHKTFSATFTDETRYLAASYYQNKVDNLFNGGITLAEEKYVTSTNPLVVQFVPYTAPEHQCEHICEVCGGCKSDCEDPACAEKCDCLTDPVDSYKYTMEYKTTTSTTTIESANAAASVGLETTVFDITATKGSYNWVGLNKAMQIRLYANENGTLNISIKGGRTIAHILVVLDAASPAQLSDLKVVVGSASVQGTRGGYFAINSDSVKLSNTGSSQLYIKRIIITCVGEGVEVHECQHVCPIDGKCLDPDCADPACTDKCNHQNVQVLEITNKNISTDIAGLEVSGVVPLDKYNEITFNKNVNSYIRSKTLGKVYMIVTDVYGKYDNMEMYAAYTKDSAKLVTGTTTDVSDMEKLYTYMFDDGTTEFYLVNPTEEHDVNMYSIKIYYEVCQHTSLTEHEAVAANCATGTDGNDQYWECNDCHQLFSDEQHQTPIDAIPTIKWAHTYSAQEVAQVPAVCEKDGVKAHYTCTVCNKKFVKQGELYVEKSDEQLKISQLGHDYTGQPWVQSDDGKHYKECVRFATCGSKGEEAACDTNAWQTDESNHQQKCSVCGRLSGEPEGHTFDDDATHKCKCGYSQHAAQVGEEYFTDLASALNKALTLEGEQTITLLANNSGAGLRFTEHTGKITIDLGTFTYTVNAAVGSAGTESQALQVLPGAEVEIKGGTIAAESGKGVVRLVNNYGNLTLNSVTLDATNVSGCDAAVVAYSGELALTNVTFKAVPATAYALSATYWSKYSDGVKVTVDELTDFATGNKGVEIDLDTLKGETSPTGAEVTVTFAKEQRTKGADNYTIKVLGPNCDKLTKVTFKGTKISHNYAEENDDKHQCKICLNSTEHEWVYYPDGDKTDTQHTVKCEGCGETKLVDHTYNQEGNKCVCGQPEPINYGSEEAPLSVTQALALAEKQCLSNSDYTEQIVVATGIVTNQPTDSGSYLKDITLRDVNDEGKTIHINTLNINDGVDKPDQNDIITIKGYIRKLNDVIEFGSKSSTHVYTIKNQRGQSSIEEGAHDGASISGLTEQPKVTNGTEIEFTVEPLDGKKVTDVKVNGTSILSSLHETNKYSFTVHGNATVTVETADEGAEEVDAYYKKITKLTDLVDGGKYLIVYEDGNFAMNGSVTTGSAVEKGINVDTNGKTQIKVDDTNKNAYFVIEKSGANYTIKSQSGYYLGNSTTSNHVDLQSDSLSNTISFATGGDVDIVCGTTHLRYNDSASMFRYYKSTSYSTYGKVYLYLLDNSGSGTGGGTGGSGGGDTEPTDKYFEKVSSGTIETGDYLIVYESSSTAGIVLSGNTDIAGRPAGKSVTIASNKIAATDTVNAMSVKITKNGGNYTIYATGQNKYFAYSGSGTNIQANDSDTTYNFTITINDGKAHIVPSGASTRAIIWSKGSAVFGMYATSNIGSSYFYPALYKLVDNQA